MYFSILLLTHSSIDTLTMDAPRHARLRNFAQSPKQAISSELEGTYITLFLHQVHQWFGHEGRGRAGLLRFLDAAHDAGYGAVMTDVPWEWTEREAQGQYSWLEFSKDWYNEVCNRGMKLHFVINMREFPSLWSSSQGIAAMSDRATNGSARCRKRRKDQPNSPSIGSEEAISLMISYVGRVVRHYTEELSSCVDSFLPTINNEMETRFPQTLDCMRDFSLPMRTLYRQWQLTSTTFASAQPRVYEPPELDELPICEPHLQLDLQRFGRWWEYRNVRLSEVYGRLCDVVS